MTETSSISFGQSQPAGLFLDDLTTAFSTLKGWTSYSLGLERSRHPGFSPTRTNPVRVESIARHRRTECDGYLTAPPPSVRRLPETP